MSVIWFAMQVVDNVHTAVPEPAVRGCGTADAELVGGARSAWFFVFCALLFRTSLAPRPLAGLGLLMVVVHAIGITLPTFIGTPARRRWASRSR